MPRKENLKKRPVNLYLTHETARALRLFAADKGIPISEVAEKAFQRVLPEKYFVSDAL